jgi:hypothetical protein
MIDMTKEEFKFKKSFNLILDSFLIKKFQTLITSISKIIYSIMD